MEFLSAYRFHMGASRLAAGDVRFEWEARFRGELDALDYRVGRIAFLAEYDVVLGHELRSFDPNQSLYALEVRATRRFGRNEVALLFHHVSRHLTDRAKTAPIDWNSVGAGIQRSERLGHTRLDVSVQGGRVVKRSYVDYTWQGGARVALLHRIGPRVDLIGEGSVTSYGTDATLAGRHTQVGALGEGGVRLKGRGGAVDLVVAVERRLDADPLIRGAERWVSVGFRLGHP